MVEASEMLKQRARGDSLRAIARRHGVSHETARRVLIAEGTRFINGVEMDLYVAHKLDSMGCEGSHPAFLIPFQDQQDWRLALDFFGWAVDQLRARDVPIRVLTRPTPAGVVHMLTLEEGTS